MTMSCIGGAGFQCSGTSIIRGENGIALTSSGVQAYGKSTSDLQTPIANTSTASGLAPAAGGSAEVRLMKGADGTVSNPALLLTNLGISWDGKSERPTIIETFSTTQGRVQADASGMLTFGALPASSDLGFYDFAIKGTAGTQLNYANNVYFPRTGNPPRCPAGVTPCPDTETTGLQRTVGDWLAGGTTPDQTSVVRLHEDGDVHAGNGKPDANGNPTILPGGSGVGVPYPGSKGYRQFLNWGYQHANLAAWFTQDTVDIAEWTGGAGSNEHNQSRSGIVAYGNVSDPATIPASGSASYEGMAYGWYARNATGDASFFHGAATVTVDFAARQVKISIRNTQTSDTAASVPAVFDAVAAMGAPGANVANYLTGPVDTGTLKGGISGRYFGPVLAGASGAGSAEIGGAYTLSDAGSGAVVLGGFIARKR